jgi:hypothetical protein
MSLPSVPNGATVTINIHIEIVPTIVHGNCVPTQHFPVVSKHGRPELPSKCLIWPFITLITFELRRRRDGGACDHFNSLLGRSCLVVQVLPLPPEPSTQGTFKRLEGSRPTLHGALSHGGGGEVCHLPCEVGGVAEAKSLPCWRGSVSWACTRGALVSLPKMALAFCKAPSSASITAVLTAAHSPTWGRCATRSCMDPRRTSHRSWAGRESASRVFIRVQAVDAQ